MAYRIKAQESVEAALRLIAREQIDKAVAEIDDPQLDCHETVHPTESRPGTAFSEPVYARSVA